MVGCVTTDNRPSGLNAEVKMGVAFNLYLVYNSAYISRSREARHLKPRKNEQSKGARSSGSEMLSIETPEVVPPSVTIVSC